MIRKDTCLPHPKMFHFNKVLCLSVLVLVINQSTQSPVKPQESQSVDLNVDISCITNASCVTNVSNKVVRALSSKKVIDFGAFSIEPVMNAKKAEGRSMSKLWELTNSNSLRVPIGSYSLTLQKSQDYDNYFEVSVSKTVEGKQHRKPQHASNAFGKGDYRERENDSFAEPLMCEFQSFLQKAEKPKSLNKNQKQFQLSSLLNI